jgi:shikimate kinase
MSLTRPIALVGLPGAGKTRVGKALAARLACVFADSDAEVERAAGATIAAIFERAGESRFRALEREAVARLLRGAPAVIALGGGAFEDEATRSALLARALVIWLDVPVPILVERLALSERRPLLEGPDIAARLRSLSQRRFAHYAQAHLLVAAATSEQMVEKILAALACGGRNGMEGPEAAAGEDMVRHGDGSKPISGGERPPRS